jgi:hypothetical protein
MAAVTTGPRPHPNLDALLRCDQTIRESAAVA